MIIENVIIASIIIAGGLLTTLIPVIIGVAKKRSVVKPVEYLPPKGASPLDIMIQYYGASAKPRDIFNPLMLYWADRGFITIEEDCKRGLTLTKVKDLVSPDSSDGFDRDIFCVEKRLFETLFFGSRKVFYTLAALADFNNEYAQIATEIKKEANKITAEKSKGCRIASLVTSFAMLLSVILIVGVSMRTNLVIISIFPVVAIVFPKLVLDLPSENDGIPKGSAVRFMMIPFFLMFGGVPFSVLVSELPASAAIVVTAAFAVCILNVFFLSKKIDIRSGKQLKYYARICGFKKFLLLAEVRQLEKLVEDDPGYYYNILPYCYVLKITEKLKPKFDRIALDGPAWYLGELRETLMF